ncbi:AAA family ATPase [Rhodococcus sp. ZPP]|nr:AAA family ATPase [Rhodococcus sp. ZPP]QTJ64372.1 AAA family ATPase [Rhodococcus sp. ZPP]
MRFDTVRVLRDSPGITTTLALSDEAHDRFVVRRLDLSMERPWSAQWLEGELEATCRARLPHIVPTRIVRKGPDYVELVRPFVAGLDIREWHAQEPRVSSEAELELVCNLFYALARLHRMGIAHGGVRPANIMLTEGSNELVLLDATVTRSQLGGLTHPADLTESRYLLPEGHGLAHPTAGFAADIYAAGWVVLEALAETNRTASALRRVKPQDDAFTEPSHLVDIVGVPAPLRPIFLKLLDPRAGQRFETAEDVLAAAEAVVATGSRETRPTSAGAPSGHHGSLAYMEPPLVGRSDELAALTASIDGAARSQGTVMCLSGESGVGKSRLLDAVVAHAEEAGVTLMRTGAFDHAPARPLGLFAGPLRDVVAYLMANPLAAQRVREDMADLLPAALEQVPELAEALEENWPAAHGAQRSFTKNTAPAGPTSIARLLLSVFDEERPGLIVLDDCQWADDLSWQVLARLAATISSDRTRSDSNVSLICSCRTEAVAQVFAWGVTDITFVGLESLSDKDTETLIRSISDGIPDEVIPYVTKYSKGNPLETLLAFQALVDSSALKHKSDRWFLDESAMAALALQPHIHDSHAEPGNSGARTDVLISPRLSLLSPETERAIRQGAVLGRRFSSRLLQVCLQASPTDVEQLMMEAAQLRIVRRVADGDGNEFEFAHDRLREAVLGNLTDATRRELHLRAAHALQGHFEVRADYDIAYHFDQAGRAASAVPFALRAGEAGLRRNALDVAERNFKIAETGLALCESADDIARFRLYEGLGTVHMLLGSYDLAAHELARAHEFTGTHSGLDAARIAALLGELAFKTGRFDDATDWMQRGMHGLDLRMPRSSAHAGLLAVGEVGLLALGWLSRRLRLGRATVDTERCRLAALIHDRLVYQLWFIKSPIWVALAILRCARFANTAGGTRERAHAYCGAAVIAGIAPILAPLALRLADFSLRLSQTAGDDWGIAPKQYAPALDAFRQADEIIRASGLRNHFLVPILTSYLQVLRLSLAAGPDPWTAEYRDQAKTARRLLRRARRLAVVFCSERPAVLREWALASFSQRHKWRGRILLGAACRSAHRQQAQGELAACALVAALVGLEPRRGPLRGLPPLAEQCLSLGIRVDGAIVESAHPRELFVGRGPARHRALLDAVSSIVASDDLDEVLDKLRDATFATTTARRVEIADGPAPSDLVGVHEPLPTPLFGDSRTVGEGPEMRVTDRLSVRVPVDGHAEKSIIAAFPLGEGEYHRPTMEVLAALAGAVIEREGLRRQSVEQMVAVQEAERGRIARDLHDEFGHLFATVIDRLSTLQNSESPTARQTAADVRKIVRQGIQVARSVAWSLRPSGLDDLGLIGCVEQYVEDCRQIYPIRIELISPTRPPALSAAVATAIFRIVQEALTNIGRHSGASEASVTIVNSGDALRVVVEDNGTGFDLEVAGQRRSLGLIGMRERARLAGGRLSVESPPGQGVTIMVEVPIER